MSTMEPVEIGVLAAAVVAIAAVLWWFFGERA